MGKEVNNLLRFLTDIALFCLMLFGVCGTIFKFLMPDGWLKGWMHEIWRFSPGYILMSAVLVWIVFFMVKRWLDSLNTKSIIGDLIMYAWVALGTYFAIKLALTGDF